MREAGVIARLLALLLGGCALGGKPPVYRYVVLTPQAADRLARDAVAGGESPVSMVIARVSVPDYLERPDVARRVGPHELVYSSRDRWAEPLGAAIERSLREDLSARLGPAILVPAGPTGERPAYTLFVDVLRFEQDRGERVELWARWTVLAGRVVLQAAETRVEVPMAGADAAAMAAALSAALARLGAEVEGAITAGR